MPSHQEAKSIVSESLKNLRVLAIPSAIGLSHLTRLVLIAQVLRECGAEVAFAYRDRQEAILRLEGFPIWPVADVIVADFTTNVYAAFSPELIKQCIQDELKAIDTFKPDLILGDFRLTAAISARIAQIPYISVVNGALTDYFNPLDIIQTEDSFGNRLARRAIRTIQNQQKKSVARHFRAAARQHGIKDLNSLFQFLEGDLTLIADIPEFCPLNNLPAHYRYIGPLIWEGDREIAQLPFVPENNLIYATTGNTGQKEFIDLVVETFGNHENYQVVLTTGAFMAPKTASYPQNIYVQPFISGSQIIPRARAVIHCGGIGSTYQALTYGKPALVIPFNNEQQINARLVKKHDVGMRLSPLRLTATQLFDTFESLSYNSIIQEHVLGFQRILSKTNGPERAAWEISSFKDSPALGTKLR